MTQQKNAFLSGEADAWTRRNEAAIAARRFPQDDALVTAALPLWPEGLSGKNVLEIGCGEGARLEWLKDGLGASCYGIEPSELAVAKARDKGLDVRRGTADDLPFENGFFDVLIFGFCLYLCDREDLFTIAREADRVLKSPGWLLIEDFYAITPVARPYHHRDGLSSFKMDYRSLFQWHPAYVCTHHDVRDHADGKHTDDPSSWVARSILRKLSSE